METAKRIAPKEIEPVIINNVLYEVLNFDREHALEQNGGYLLAKDNQTGEELEKIKIYDIQYDEQEERDTQDIFIKSIEIFENSKIKITDELGRIFIFDTVSKSIVLNG